MHTKRSQSDHSVTLLHLGVCLNSTVTVSNGANYEQLLQNQKNCIEYYIIAVREEDEAIKDEHSENSERLRVLGNEENPLSLAIIETVLYDSGSRL